MNRGFHRIILVPDLIMGTTVGPMSKCLSPHREWADGQMFGSKPLIDLPFTPE
jgi:hypothetical protein